MQCRSSEMLEDVVESFKFCRIEVLEEWDIGKWTRLGIETPIRLITTCGTCWLNTLRKWQEVKSEILSVKDPKRRKIKTDSHCLPHSSMPSDQKYDYTHIMTIIWWNYGTRSQLPNYSQLSWERPRVIISKLASNSTKVIISPHQKKKSLFWDHWLYFLKPCS